MKLRIYKYDPAVDAAPRYAEGEVGWREKMTALEALEEFHENVEPINFDYSCACRLCGRCSMMINGAPALPCVTPVEDAEYTFEPLAGYPVVRDLVVDKTSFDDALTRIYDRVRIEPFDAETIVPENYDPAPKMTRYALEFCCRCGSCTAGCPAVASYPNDYAGPAAMTAIAYRHLDPLDCGDRVMEAVNAGLFRCIMCGKCDEYCEQQDIKHLELWQTLRDAATERGLVPSYAK